MFKKNVIAILFLFVLFFVLNVSLKVALAEDNSYGLDSTAKEISAFSGQSISDNFIQTKAGQIIGTLLSFVGVIFLILIIYSGLMWMTAQGNSQQVDKAKDLLVNAVSGIIIVFAAYALTAFMGNFISNQLLNK